MAAINTVQEETSHYTVDPKETLDTVKLIESIHGQQRRVERSIEIRDLKSAVKNGKKKLQLRTINGKKIIRYKYTFAHIVYITDETSTTEITSWFLPLQLNQVNISDNDQLQYESAKLRINNDPDIITSHFVLVIDCSASMKNSDVMAHRSRADAVSYAVASEFIAKRLDNPLSGVSQFHVVTVIEMRDDARLIFEKEPMNWVFYNKFITKMNEMKPRSHGNYIPSLKLAMDVLKKNDHENLAPFLFFLSDGHPSDKCPHEEIYRYTKVIGSHFQKRLTFSMERFGSPVPENDLSVVKAMAYILEMSGAVGGFNCSAVKKFGSLTTSLANISSQLASTSSLLNEPRIKNHKEKEIKFSIFKKDIKLRPDNWECKTVRQNNLKCYELVRAERHFTWKQRQLLHHESAGITYDKNPFGRGAERLVYQLREIDVNGKIIGSPLVGKDGKYVEYVEGFHFSFCITQKIASNFAERFNQKLDRSCRVGKKVPRVKFLDCYVYAFYVSEEIYYYLVEKELDNKQYKKWNDNKGGINGRSNKLSSTNRRPITKMLKDLSTISEELSENETSDEESTTPHQTILKRNELVILNDEVPQAFSHFTYIWSKYDKIVCDLQGVLDTTKEQPVFEFTDPAIHYKSKSGEKKRGFGRTDRGHEGIDDFFRSHTCNNVCKALVFNTS